MATLTENHGNMHKLDSWLKSNV